MQKVIYAVYKGEDFLCEGTAKECADYLGVKAKTIYWWKSPANCKKASGKTKYYNKDKKRKYAIVIEED